MVVRGGAVCRPLTRFAAEGSCVATPTRRSWKRGDRGSPGLVLGAGSGFMARFHLWDQDLASRSGPTDDPDLGLVQTWVFPGPEPV